jgi:rubrerythrin
MNHLDLEHVDTDGAISEAAEAVAGDTRLSFLRKGAIAGGAAVSGGAILGALIAPGLASAAGGVPRKFGPLKFAAGDVGILQFALTLEYLEAAFYNEAAKNGIVKSPHTKAFLKTVVRDENAHVAYLKKGLGSAAPKAPKFDFGKATKDEATFTATAFVLENTGVHAYLGQAGNIKTPAYLLAAASIVTIEARHAGAIGLILGKPIAPSGSFDTPFSATTILNAVKATKFVPGL